MGESKSANEESKSNAKPAASSSGDAVRVLVANPDRFVSVPDADADLSAAYHASVDGRPPATAAVSFSFARAGDPDDADEPDYGYRLPCLPLQAGRPSARVVHVDGGGAEADGPLSGEQHRTAALGALDAVANDADAKRLGLLLLAASARGDADEATELLEFHGAPSGYQDKGEPVRGCDENAAPGRGGAAALPLHNAAAAGHEAIVAALLDAGASVRDVDEHGNTPLHCACLNGHGRVAKVLLKNGAKPGAKNLHGYTPLALVPTKGKSALGHDKRALGISVDELQKLVAKSGGKSRKK